MGDDLGNNLLQPGDNPHDNVQFLVFCAAVLRAVYKSQGLLRASIASAGNDHRLGANEAPPAIISVFLGDMLTDIFEQIEKGAAKSTKSGGILETGVSVLPKLPRDAGDRNRTSPFAFTGNKFEFRAVSSGQSIAMPNICLNVAVADSLAYVADELEKATAGGQSLDAAVGKLLTKMIKESKPIIFNGNNYSAEWEKEAAKRKLLNLKNTVDALPELVTPAGDQGLRDAQGAQRARGPRAPRDHARAVRQDDQRRGAADGADGQPLHPAGGAELPDARWRRAWRRARRRACVSAETKKLLTGFTKTIDGFRKSTDKLAARARSPRRLGREARQVHARHGRPGDGRAARAGRQDRDDGAVELVAAADLPRDALHQVGGRRYPLRVRRREPAIAPALVACRHAPAWRAAT